MGNDIISGTFFSNCDSQTSHKSIKLLSAPPTEIYLKKYRFVEEVSQLSSGKKLPFK